LCLPTYLIQKLLLMIVDEITCNSGLGV
jgi:hypothetical protein